jgi:hypothetical protein
MATMTTYSGLEIDPMKLKESDIKIEDIAHALSLLCRGSGHLKYFYSVGQHSINCSDEAETRGYSKRIILACLLHDSSEAYISDIVRPVKANLPEYVSVEKNILGTIFEKFGIGDLSAAENDKWKKVDDEMMETELMRLMHGHEGDRVSLLLSKPNVEEETPAEVEKEYLLRLRSILAL